MTPFFLGSMEGILTGRSRYEKVLLISLRNHVCRFAVIRFFGRPHPFSPFKKDVTSKTTLVERQAFVKG